MFIKIIILWFRIFLFNKWESGRYKYSWKQLKLIVQDNYKCQYCDKSIWELTDFPVVVLDDRILCEECYDENYYEVCDLCEEKYEKVEEQEEFPKAPFYYNRSDPEHVAGIYEAINYPIWSSNYFECDVFWDNVRLVCTLKDFIEKKKWKDDIEGAEHICDDCYEFAKKIKKQKELI